MSDPQTPDDEEGPRGRQTVAAAVVVALLLIGGWWLISALQRHRELENCLASGRRDCVPLETGR